ncbi:MAG: F0F1 ATP synthase subunit A [Coriobacteriia bacterium]|nr:F0F1 ATP synthase subunit A [Coriobacteriia bacterium]
MGPLEELGHHISELLEDLGGMTMFDFGWGSITPFTVYLILTLILVAVIILSVKKRVTLIPKRGPTAAVEAAVDYVRKEIGFGVLGSKELVDKHMPFLFTIFFFILASNLIGLIPGAKAATGTFSVTLTLAIFSFVYFNYHGMKHAGVLHYVKNIAPAGLIPGLNVLVWLIELFSLFLRIVTLSVRLFANMFAGHIIMGVFSILASLFVLPAIHNFSLATLGGATPALGWLILLICIYALELLVAFIQAYVFTLLSAVYLHLATSKH